MPAHCVIIHPAIEKSRELHEQEGDFTYQELFFVRRVGEIVRATVLTRQIAADLFGECSTVYRASCDLAKRQEAADLTIALNYFLNSVEQQEQMLA